MNSLEINEMECILAHFYDVQITGGAVSDNCRVTIRITVKSKISVLGRLPSRSHFSNLSS